MEIPQGLVLISRDQAKALLRAQLAGGSLVDELLEERRSAAAAERA